MLGRRSILKVLGFGPMVARQSVATLAGGGAAARASAGALMYGAADMPDLVSHSMRLPRGVDRFSPYGIALHAFQTRDRVRDERRNARRAVRAGFLHAQALPSWGAAKAREFTVRQLEVELEEDRVYSCTHMDNLDALKKTFGIADDDDPY